MGASSGRDASAGGAPAGNALRASSLARWRVLPPDLVAHLFRIGRSLPNPHIHCTSSASTNSGTWSWTLRICIVILITSIKHLQCGDPYNVSVQWICGRRATRHPPPRQRRNDMQSTTTRQRGPGQGERSAQAPKPARRAHPTATPPKPASRPFHRQTQDACGAQPRHAMRCERPSRQSMNERERRVADAARGGSAWRCASFFPLQSFSPPFRSSRARRRTAAARRMIPRAPARTAAMPVAARAVVAVAVRARATSASTAYRSTSRAAAKTA